MKCVETASHGTRSQRCPGSRRLGDTLEVQGSEILQLEEITKEVSRSVSDHNGVRLGDPLQACREVRGLTDNASLLRFARTDEVADHHEPGCDADTYRKGRAGGAGELRHRLNQSKPGLYGTLGVMLVCLRITKIRKHSITHILCDEPPISLDQIGAAAMISANDGS